MNHYVMDFETLSNCFVAVFEHYKDDRRKVFIIHRLANHINELLEFLDENVKNKEWHVSFNGLGFDSQITQYILKERTALLKMSADEAARSIYKKAQQIIDRQENGEWAEYSEKDLLITNLDVFKLNHWDNPAKRSSLKWIQYSMDWDNIQEMPIHHSTNIRTWKELHLIIDYCINDVRSTKRIMQLSKEQIALRRNLTNEYKIQLYSASEPRISKELFMLFLSQNTGIPKYELRQLRTNRTAIQLGDLILPYTKFKTKPFQELLELFKGVTIDARNTKGGFKCSMPYKGIKTDFGLGGVHGAKEAGIYESKDGMIIMTSDVTSFYPNLAIRNKWSPAHLPMEAFCELYEWFFEERKKISKKDIKNYVYKIILNSTFGLSIDKNSFLYDPQFGMQITINGQLTLMMLYEMLAEGIPDCTPLMQNTDGLEMIIPEQYKDKYMEICAEWEKITNLQLEHDEYSKLVLADVNNYIAVHKDGKVKSKGRFEFDNLALHKNKSFLIIPKALHEFFVNDKLPEQSIAENKNIFDYCGGVKIKGEWKFISTCILDGDIIKEELQKTVRYYISNRGCKITKTNIIDGREIQIESGKWLLTDMSKLVKKPWEEYDIDTSYYIDRVYKEISNVINNNNQLTLF